MVDQTSDLTIQGVNYKAATPVDYADVWSLQGVQLSAKAMLHNSERHYRWFDHTEQCCAALYWTAAPNAGCQHGRSTRATFNTNARDDEAMFFLGVEWAVRTTLLAMAFDRVEVALLPLLGGGLYAGRWRPGYEGKFNHIVKTVLEAEDGGGTLIGSHFREVVIVVIGS